MTTNRRQMLGLIGAAPLLLSNRPYERVTVYEAAHIVTMEPSQPSARFIAVSNGIILALGNSLSDLDPWLRGRTVEVDRRYRGKVMMPGFIEPHIHPMQSAVMLNIPFVAPDDWDLPSGRYPGARTPAAWRARLTEELARSRATPFICWGYHEMFHGPLDRAALDLIAPDRPVIIWQRSFHDVIINSRAMAEWGFADEAALAAAVSATRADPAHVDFAAGLFSETGLAIALAKMNPVILAPSAITAGMVDLKRMLSRRGVTTASDMGTGIFAGFDIESTVIHSAFETTEGRSRVMLMPIASLLASESDPLAWLTQAQARFTGSKVLLNRRVKMLADGAFFAQNMRMNAPGYTDGHIGKWITEPVALHAQIERFWSLGFALHIHVNGDEGLDVVLDAVDRLAPQNAQTITLEHVGYSTAAQVRRIARSGLMVSAQPNYIRVLGNAYGRQGLGTDRASQMNRLGSMERLNIPLGLHSDFNMAPVDPLYLAWIAANRITIEGRVLAPEERLTIDKALRAITIEAAQVIGLDASVGSLAAGKKADMVVLDRDPYRAGAMALKDIAVEGVIFEGQLAGS